MSQENVEVVRRLYRAMNAHDVAGATELMSPDAEWIPDSRIGERPVRGREEVIRFFTDRAEMFDELRIEPERLSATEDRVLAFLSVTGRGQASHAAFEIRIAHLWTLRDGMLARGEGFGDRSEALKAAGLRE